MFDRGMTLSLYTTPSYQRDTGGWGGHAFGHVHEVTVVCIEDRRSRNTTIRPLPASSQVHAPTSKAPPARLVVRRLREVDVWTVEPHEDRRSWYMAGGAYAASCDSRFSDVVGFGAGAIAVHDRYENPSLWGGRGD